MAVAATHERAVTAAKAVRCGARPCPGPRADRQAAALRRQETRLAPGEFLTKIAASERAKGFLRWTLTLMGEHHCSLRRGGDSLPVAAARAALLRMRLQKWGAALLRPTPP